VSTFDQILKDETLGRLFGRYAEDARAAEAQRLTALALPRRLDVPCAACGDPNCDVRVWRVS